ncbi:MAG TPA: tetratricopeptide repeat protein [Longimicrobiales bacterium]|nr:tetratricopeptide repeat protein [Longimicrobiales bacterium]
MAESHREEIAKLEALYAGNPGGRVFVHLAEAYRKAGEHERARRILDEGLARHPDSASGYVVLGRVLADMQITGEAEIAFRRVLDLDGGNLVALRWLGDLARQSGRNADAAMHYRELLIRNPSNEEVRDLVEIVEREAEGTGAAVAARADDDIGETGADELRVDAFPGLDDREEPESALAGQQAEAEQAALTPPPPVGDAAPPDITPWSAAPGRTGDAEEPPVEYGLVELDTSATAESPYQAAGASAGPLESGGDAAHGEPSDATASDAAGTPNEGAPGAAEPVAHAGDEAPERPAPYEDRPAASAAPTWPADESDVVASIDEGDTDALELDELRRDDEAEPLEIHLLDPSYEASAEEETEDFVGELDLSDMVNAGSLEDADDYADETFVADLTSAGEEPAAPDELPGGVDVLDAALTLLPDDTDEDAAGHASQDAETEEPASFGYAVGTPAGESPEAEDRVAFADDTGSAADSAEPASWPGAGVAETEPELSEAGFTALSGAAEPAAESTPAPEARRTEPGLVTETMAVLYRSQGFHDRAADVYRALLRTRPDDARLAARLREAEDAAAAEAGPRTEDEAGEVWLRGVGAAWTAEAESSGTAETTPYAWTGEAEDGETGEPIGTYLHDLVSWKAGSGNWPPRDVEPPETQAPGEIEVPEWLNGPGSSEQWTPEPEREDYPVVPAAESDWAPAETEPWATTPDTVTPDTATPEEITSDAVSSEGADVADLTEGALDAWGLPADEAPDTSSDAEPEEESGGWTPLELDRDVPGAGQPAAAAEEQQAARADEDDSSEDDDLEMFRSWLQSLKK